MNFIKEFDNPTIEDIGQEEDTREKEPKRKRKKGEIPNVRRKRFLPRVTMIRRKRKRSTPLFTEEEEEEEQEEFIPDEPTNPFVGKLQDVIITEEESRNPTSIYGVGATESQSITQGYIKGTIENATLSHLKYATAYLLKRGDIIEPENFDKYDQLQETGGGKEILLNEILKEPPEVLYKYYLLIGRVKPLKVAKSEKVTTLSYKTVEDWENGGARKSDSINDGIEVEKKEVIDYPFIEPEITPQDNYSTEEDYVVIPGSNTMLKANIGAPHDDSRIYIEYPVRKIGDKKDHWSDDITDICGSQVNRFFQRTAKETQAHDDMDQYEDDRQEIGQWKRIFCPPTRESISSFMDLIETDADPYEPQELDDESRQELYEMGFDDREIDDRYGLKAKKSLRSDIDE